MDNKNDGGQAFPSNEYDGNGEHPHFNQGMTLRRWYAGQALSGMIAHPKTPAPNWDLIVEHAFKLADAMIRHELEDKRG